MPIDIPNEVTLGTKLPALIRSASSSGLELLAVIIKSPEVEVNTVAILAEILAAFTDRRGELKWGEEDLGVSRYLRDAIELAESYQRGFEDGLHGRFCRPDSRRYVNGFTKGLEIRRIRSEPKHQVFQDGVEGPF